MTLGALGVVLFLVAVESFWRPRIPYDYLTVAPVIISLLVATASTYFAAHALLEQRRTRQAGTDPVLIAHLGQRQDARELVTFNISNVGSGAALNVRLEVEEPDDKEEDRAKRNLLRKIFKQHHTISVVLQGQSVEFDFALGWHILGQDSTEHNNDRSLPSSPLPPFQATIHYEDLAGGQYDSVFTIDVLELQDRGANKSPQMRVVKALETIAKKLTTDSPGSR
jgi:hypothetical protein